MRAKIAFAVILIGMLTNPPVKGDQKRWEALRDGPVSQVQPLAVAGDPDAEFALCMKYASGLGVPQGFVEAARWCRKAAEQGQTEAIYAIGLMYRDGQGLDANPVEAARWIHQAAEAGSAAAQHDMAVLYERGAGVPIDHTEALRWHLRSAQGGFGKAQYNIGLFYFNGDGVPKDRVLAAEWFRKAAAQGNVAAKHNLGVMYRDGEGVARDPIESVRWYRQAAELGYADSEYSLGDAYLLGSGVPASGTAAADWYYRAGLAYLKNGQRDRSLACADRIRNLPTLMGSAVPNVFLADQLLRAAYGKAEPPQSTPDGPTVSMGTGWVVSGGYIVTNHHVVRGHGRVQVTFRGSPLMTANIAVTDRTNDLVLLTVETPKLLPAPISLARVEPGIGAKVFTIGFPHPDIMGIEPKLTDGTISARTGIRDDVRWFQISVPVQAGNSGGPLLNMDGEAVGIVVAKLDAAKVQEGTGDLPENVNYAIKLAYLRALMPRTNLQPTPRERLRAVGSGPTLEDLARRVADSIGMVVAE